MSWTGGRYDVAARINERKHTFRDDTDRFHFLESLGELGERFVVRACLHASVLMDNHYRLAGGDTGSQSKPTHALA